MSARPEPFTPPTADLRTVPGTLMFWGKLFASDLWLDATGDEFKATLALWGKATTQTPAGSLPTEERRLAKLAEVSHTEWPTLRDMALRGWIECSDGRLYHPVVADAVLTAWKGRLAAIKRSTAGNDKRNKRPFDPAPHDAALAEAERRHALVKAMIADRSEDPAEGTVLAEGDETAPLGTADDSLRDAPTLPKGLPQGEDEAPSGTLFGSQVEVEVKSTVSGAKAPSTVADEFAQFWAGYPKKVGKTGRGGAEGAFTSARKRADWPGVDAVIDDVRWRTANHDEWLRGYAPNPTTYLNQSRWLDDRPGEAEAERADATAYTDADWRRALAIWGETKGWAARLGPEPGQPGCKVPAHLLLTRAAVA